MQTTRNSFRITNFYLATLLVVVSISVLSSRPTLAVFGGSDATGSPLVVTMYQTATSRTPFCSGALLSERIVVTAAHCFTKSQSETQELVNQFAYVAEPGVDTATTSLDKRVPISEVVILPDYINTWVYPEDRRTSIHDIAFLFLKSPLVAGYEIPVATEVEVANLKSNRSTLRHFGYGLQQRDNGSIPNRPRMVDLQIRPRTYSYEVTSPAAESMTIITDETGDSALCGGDSGGPSYANINGHWKLVAVLSGASGCRGEGSGRGGTFGTLVQPYLTFLGSQWQSFPKRDPEILRQNAEVDGSYLEIPGCHEASISAMLQAKRDDGLWIDVKPAMGRIYKPACPETNGYTFWTSFFDTSRKLIRWRISDSAGSWTVYSGEQTTPSPSVTTTTTLPKTLSSGSSKNRKVLVCKSNSRTIRVTGKNPKCPRGYRPAN